VELKFYIRVQEEDIRVQEEFVSSRNRTTRGELEKYLYWPAFFYGGMASSLVLICGWPFLHDVLVFHGGNCRSIGACRTG